jgi:hypothetical protein
VSLIQPLRGRMGRSRNGFDRGERLIFDLAPGERERVSVPGALGGRDVDILVSLWRHRYLSTPQIHRTWWPEHGTRGAQRRLARLHAAGMVDRFRPLVDAGRASWVYRLTAHGFDTARSHAVGSGSPLPPEAKFRLAQPVGFSQARHDLEMVDWLLDLRDLAGGMIMDWLGDQEAIIAAPASREVRALRNPRAADGRPVRSLHAGEAQAIHPDGELRIRSRARSLGYAPWLIEYDRTRDGGYQVEKWRRYDALISAWWQHSRLRDHDRPPVVCFVCPDGDTMQRYLERADPVVCAAVGAPADPPDQLAYPAREQLVFVSRQDPLTAWRLDPKPPTVRGEQPASHRPQPLAAQPATPTSDVHQQFTS